MDIFYPKGPGWACREDGKTFVDLDLLETYPKRWLKLTTSELHDEVWGEMGKSLVYMDYLRPCKNNWEPQRRRIEHWIFLFAYEWRAHIENTPENRLWWMKLLFRFNNEVENQC